jgi:hypothetical protein
MISVRYNDSHIMRGAKRNEFISLFSLIYRLLKTKIKLKNGIIYY